MSDPFDFHAAAAPPPTPPSLFRVKARARAMARASPGADPDDLIAKLHREYKAGFDEPAARRAIVAVLSEAPDSSPAKKSPGMAGGMRAWLKGTGGSLRRAKPSGTNAGADDSGSASGGHEAAQGSGQGAGRGRSAEEGQAMTASAVAAKPKTKPKGKASKRAGSNRVLSSGESVDDDVIDMTGADEAGGSRRKGLSKHRKAVADAAEDDEVMILDAQNDDTSGTNAPARSRRPVRVRRGSKKVVYAESSDDESEGSDSSGPGSDAASKSSEDVTNGSGSAFSGESDAGNGTEQTVGRKGSARVKAKPPAKTKSRTTKAPQSAAATSGRNPKAKSEDKPRAATPKEPASSSSKSPDKGKRRAAAVPDDEPPLDPGCVPLHMPKTAKGATTVLAQLADDKLDLTGDTGAIGRVQVEGNDLLLDLKGHRYTGNLMSSCTMMVIGYNATKNTAKVESMVDECLHLSHTRDVIAAMEGVFTAGTRDAGLFSRFEDVDEHQGAGETDSALPRSGSSSSGKGKAKKRKASGGRGAKKARKR